MTRFSSSVVLRVVMAMVSPTDAQDASRSRSSSSWRFSTCRCVGGHRQVRATLTMPVPQDVATPSEGAAW